MTTHVQAAEAVYQYCRTHCSGEIVIAEGCGSGTTADTFRVNGYNDLAAKYGIRLIDLNGEETVLVKNSRARTLKEFYMPKILQDAFVISLPVLKDHSFTKTTIAMKNMFGIAPTPYYSGSWNKSKLHRPSTDQNVVDVCLYKKPDLSVVDAARALTGSHLSGKVKKTGVILAGFDPVSVDAVGSELLGHKAGKVKYLQLADGLLGSMKDIEVLTD